MIPRNVLNGFKGEEMTLVDHRGAANDAQNSWFEFVLFF